MKLAWADQAYTGEKARSDAQAHVVPLKVVKLPQVLGRLHFLVFVAAAQNGI